MDAFISYRRKTGGIYALEIYKFLKDDCGMNVFYDRDGLYGESGNYFSIIEKNIENSENFILILTDLEIDDFENNIFIKEIETALDNKKNIIVTFANQFNSFDKLPPKLKELENKELVKKITKLDMEIYYFKKREKTSKRAVPSAGQPKRFIDSRINTYRPCRLREPREQRGSLPSYQPQRFRW